MEPAIFLQGKVYSNEIGGDDKERTDGQTDGRSVAPRPAITLLYKRPV
jgi:hypothetical protein